MLFRSKANLCGQFIHFMLPSKFDNGVTFFIAVEGICEGISSGTVTLSLAAGKCKGYSRAGECYWGWNSYVHLMISESFVEREIIQF